MPDFTHPQMAQLTPQQLARVQQLEQQLGEVYVVAYQAPLLPAELTAQQLQALQSAERELGACLVAYRKA